MDLGCKTSFAKEENHLILIPTNTILGLIYLHIYYPRGRAAPKTFKAAEGNTYPH